MERERKRRRNQELAGIKKERNGPRKALKNGMRIAEKIRRAIKRNQERRT